MKLTVIAAFVLLFHSVLIACDDTETSDDVCDHNFNRPTGLNRYLNFGFVGKVVKSLVPKETPNVKMHFFLYKNEFPSCGREILLDDDYSLQSSGFNASHPTRIIIHGWMSRGKASPNRKIKDAYLSIGDFNVIIVDWGVLSNTFNYYKVAKLVDDYGEMVANFTKHLHNTLYVDYDSIYLIGHSLGAQIAGSAGKHIQPEKFNTIFALDPAGPAFRENGLENRIDSTDAKYVESIQTSDNLGFTQPVGNASFFPNKGSYQKCFGLGCSHRRAQKLFTESITSSVGFWGTLCDKEDEKLDCPESIQQYKMGGEPSTPKNGVFYLKTNARPPYALGRNNKYLYA